MTAEEKTKFMTGMFQGATFENSQVIGIAESGSTIIFKKEGKEESHPHFPLHSNKDEGLRLFDGLTDKSFMQGHQDSWLFFMGFVEQKPQKVKKIIWMGNKEQLRVMLRMLNEDSLNSNSLSVAEIERLTPKIFVDKNNNPLKLAKPKEENSQMMDKLKEIFRPSPTSYKSL